MPYTLAGNGSSSVAIVRDLAGIGGASESRTGNQRTVLLDGLGAVEAASGPIVVPEYWATFDVYAWLFNQSTTAGDIYVNLYMDRGVDGDNMNAKGESIAAGVLLTVSGPAVGNTTVDRELVVSGVSLPAVAWQSFRFERDSSQATDTVGNDVAIAVLELRKAS